MGNILLLLIVCLLIAACSDSGSHSAPAPATKTESETSQVSEQVYSQAQILGKIYGSWKERTQQISWASEDVEAFKTAQAYLLAQECFAYRASTKAPVILWLLEKFQTIKDPSGDGTEMTALAQEYLKKSE